MADDDPRKILIQELGYLENNRGRMDYPRYRQQGLPWTSSHVESTVKLFNRRVKGSEKFWGETGAEAILQLRAAFLSEDGRLEQHLRSGPAVRSVPTNPEKIGRRRSPSEKRTASYTPLRREPQYRIDTIADAARPPGWARGSRADSLVPGIVGRTQSWATIRARNGTCMPR